METEATCGICGRNARSPYYRVVGGELVEHCAGKIHRPHIVRPSNASAFLARFDKAMKAEIAAKRKAGTLTELDLIAMRW